jgi:murein DD-endopeptidase MepM/ murein hydrolase activator NlpD
MSKKLTEIAERLKKVSEKLGENKAEEKKDDKKVVEGTIRVGTSLNVRTGPWGRIIGSLYDGNKVKITGENGDWYKIDYNGQTAYIHKNYVDTSNRKAGTTPVNQSNGNQSPQTDPGNKSSGGALTAAPCSPMPSRVSSEFGYRIHPTLGYKKFHNGIDLPIPNGTRLNALGDGVVTAVGYESGGGRYIKVKYANGYESFYCHLKSYSVKKGQKVSAGQEIARSDNTGQWTTGAHLHFGLKKNGQYVNPRSAGIPLPR